MKVNGNINLNNAVMLFTVGFTATNGCTFTLINNDGADAIAGTFAGMPEGAFITNGSSLFRISYTGGDGNDLVLYRVNPPPKFTSIMRLTNSTIQLDATGVSNLTYTLQASTNLVNWSNIASVTANANGLLSFVDTNVASLARRFYRALSP